MKRPPDFLNRPRLWPRLLIVVTLLTTSVWAQKPKAAETTWPGVTAEIYTITRLPDNRVSVKFIYQATDKAPEWTYIADRVITSLVVVDQTPNPEAETPEDVAGPYSIEKGGQLIAEDTGKIYQAAKMKSDEQWGAGSHPGPSETLEALRPGNAFFLGGLFDCPSVSIDDPPKPQFVSFKLPGLKGPITRVLLPREINKPHQFFPPVRYTAPPVTP